MKSVGMKKGKWELSERRGGDELANNGIYLYSNNLHVTGREAQQLHVCLVGFQIISEFSTFHHSGSFVFCQRQRNTGEKTVKKRGKSIQAPMTYRQICSITKFYFGPSTP